MPRYKQADPSTIMTIAALSRSKRPLVYLPEFRHLQKQVELLREDNEDQVELERQSQKTFEFLVAQVKALKGAFATLSEVVVDEVQCLKEKMAEQGMAMKDMKQELRAHRAEGDRVLEWVKRAQKDLVGVQTLVDQAMGTEAGYVRKVAKGHEKAIQEVSGQLAGVVSAMESLRRGSGEQRVEDLEIMQSALETSQRQQRRSEARVAELERTVQQLLGKVAEQDREQEDLKANLADTVQVLKLACATGSATSPAPANFGK